MDFGTFTLGTGYFPNSGKRGNLNTLERRLKFNKAVAETLKKLDKPFVLVGDLNVVSGDEGVEGGLQADHWLEHPGCTATERADFAELKRVNDRRHAGRVGCGRIFKDMWVYGEKRRSSNDDRFCVGLALLV